MDDFVLDFGEALDCPINPPEAEPHKPSLGDCTYQHTLCEWKIVLAENPETQFVFNQTTGKIGPIC